MRNRKLRILSLLLVLVFAVGLLAGCNSGTGGNDEPKSNGDDNPSSGGDKTPAKDSIVIATMGETPSLSPTEHNAVAGSYMNVLTYNTLFRTGMDLNPEPSLVDTYKNVDDSTWQFTMKKGVKFHNGNEMKAEDVKASIEWAQGFPEVNLYNLDIKSIEVVDDYTAPMPCC